MKGYEIKNLKVFPSKEYGPKGGCSCTLYCDGKKVGTVLNAGDGGDIDFNYNSIEEGKKFKASFAGKKIPNEFGMDMDWTEESEIFKLIGEFEENKQYKKVCKKGTVYKLADESKDSYYVLDIPFNEAVAKALKEQFGDKLAEIVNLRFA